MPETPSVYFNDPNGYGTAAVLGAVGLDGEVKKIPVGSLFEEMGGTGLKRSAGVIDEEFLPALRGTKGVAVFKEMSLNDPVVGALLFTIEKLLRQVDWSVTGDDQSPEQSKAVQFVEECMNDMSHSFDDLIAEILSMLIFGWSWHEIVYKKRIGPWEKDPKRKSKYTDGKIGWRKIPIRSQETLFRWVFDEDGGIKAFVQIPPPRYVQTTIPVEKSLLFRVGTHKGNPEGVSILRNAYRPWYFKKRLEEFEAIGVERDLAGLPTAKIPSRMMKANATPDDQRVFKAFKKLVSNVRRDEHEGIVIPSDTDPDTKTPLYEFELMSAGGTRSFDTNALIERNSQAILMTVLADFIMVGHQDGGSYALHVDKTGIFRAALNSIVQSIADVFNRHAIPRLFAANGWKLERLPKLEPSNVDPPNLTELGQFMTQMSGLGMAFFPDPDLEKFLRETAHLPKLGEDAEEMRREMAEQQNAVDFMQSKMGAQGAQQASQLVDQGMSPEQAQLEAETPHPDGLAGQQAQQEQEMAMAQGDQKMQIAQQQADLKGQQGEQQLQLGAAQGEQKLSHAQAAHEQKLAQTDAQTQQQLATSDAQAQQKLATTQATTDQSLANTQVQADQKNQISAAQGQQQLAQGDAQAQQKQQQEAAAADFEAKMKQIALEFEARMKAMELGHAQVKGKQEIDQTKKKGELGLKQSEEQNKQKLKLGEQQAKQTDQLAAKREQKKASQSKFKRS